MSDNNITRRVAIGTAVAGLIGVAVIVCFLRGTYEVDLPEGTRPMTLGGKTVTHHGGVQIEIEVPKMVIETPEDENKFKELVMEEIKKTPQYATEHAQIRGRTDRAAIGQAARRLWPLDVATAGRSNRGTGDRRIDQP